MKLATKNPMSSLLQNADRLREELINLFLGIWSQAAIWSLRKYARCKTKRDWEVSSVGKVLAPQAWGPEFKSPAAMLKQNKTKTTPKTKQGIYGTQNNSRSFLTAPTITLNTLNYSPLPWFFLKWLIHCYHRNLSDTGLMNQRINWSESLLKDLGIYRTKDTVWERKYNRKRKQGAGV